MGGFVGASWLTLAVPAVTYALGYAYFVSYFGSFGLGVQEIPIEQVFRQGALSFLIALLPEDMDFFQFLPLVSTIVLVVLAVAPLGKLERFRPLVAAAAVLCLLLSAAPAAFRQGRMDAENVIHTPPVYLALAEIPAVVAPARAQEQSCQQLEAGAVSESPAARWSARATALTAANACGSLRLIWQDANATTVGTRSCRRVGGGQGCGWQVFRVSAEQVAITMIDRRPRRGGQP